MLERFLTQRPNAPRDDLAYLMERLDQPAAAPVATRSSPSERPAGNDRPVANAA